MRRRWKTQQVTAGSGTTTFQMIPAGQRATVLAAGVDVSAALSTEALATLRLGTTGSDTRLGPELASGTTPGFFFFDAIPQNGFEVRETGLVLDRDQAAVGGTAVYYVYYEADGMKDAADQVWTVTGGSADQVIIGSGIDVLITAVGYEVGAGVTLEMQSRLRSGGSTGFQIRPPAGSGTTPGFAYQNWPDEGFVSDGIYFDGTQNPTGGTVTLYIYGRIL